LLQLANEKNSKQLMAGWWHRVYYHRADNVRRFPSHHLMPYWAKLTSVPNQIKNCW
jgi:hypothetical protein